MDKIHIPDPQILEMEALDNAFYDWCLENQNNDEQDVDYWCEQWNSLDRDALVYTQDDFYDDYDPMTGEYGSSCMAAMENDMRRRIEAKRSIIRRINEDE